MPNRSSTDPKVVRSHMVATGALTSQETEDGHPAMAVNNSDPSAGDKLRAAYGENANQGRMNNPGAMNVSGDVNIAIDAAKRAAQSSDASNKY